MWFAHFKISSQHVSDFTQAGKPVTQPTHYFNGTRKERKNSNKNWLTPIISQIS